MGGVGGPRAVLRAGMRRPVGTRGEGERGDEMAVGGWFAGAVASPGRPCCWGKECVEGQ